MCWPIKVPFRDSISGGAVEINMIIRHLAARLAREYEQRGNTAVDIDPAVGACCTGLGRQRVKGLLVLHQVLGKCFEHVAALVKRHAAQVGSAYLAGMLQHGSEVEPIAS